MGIKLNVLFKLNLVISFYAFDMAIEKFKLHI